MKKAGIVCCSNGQKRSNEQVIQKLDQVLRLLDMEPVYSECIYEKDDVFSGTALERAAELMKLYRDEDVGNIFDISGGDIGNGVLPYLDYELIAGSDKIFWGYSDLTTVINAIYTKTGKASVLYQIKNLVYENGKERQEDFRNQKLINDFTYAFVQGHCMEGVVIGGNIRCFLKLAGTQYMPDFEDKILLLESMGGSAAQLETYLFQLQQMGAFEKISGILLGTFTQFEKELCEKKMGVLSAETVSAAVYQLLSKFVPKTLPIAVTREIGHGRDAKGILVGANLQLKDI